MTTITTTPEQTTTPSTALAIQPRTLATMELRPGHHARVALEEKGETWLVAGDVAQCFGVEQTGPQFVRVLDAINHAKGVHSTHPLSPGLPAQRPIRIPTDGGEQEVICINMPAVFHLATRSRKTAGKQVAAYLISASTRALKELQAAQERAAAKPAIAWAPIPGSLPPGMDWEQLAAQAVEEVRRWEAKGTGQPISGWRLGPILGVHQAVVERALDDAVARGELFGRTTFGGKATEYATQPLPQQERPAPPKKQETAADKAKALEERVLKALRDARGPVSGSEVRRAVGGRWYSLVDALNRLATAGRVRRDADGWAALDA
jgi:hypothetical protein